MTGFVLQRVPDGKYVARPGSEQSYTSKLKEARVFDTCAQADRDRCIENEMIVALDTILRGGRSA